MDKLDRFLDRADRLLDRLEHILPKASAHGVPDWSAAHAFRWERAKLAPVTQYHHIKLSDLLGIDDQKQLIEQNTRQFVQGRPANNVLLSGSRGTGKSSLVKALLNEYAKDGLRLIELGKLQLAELPLQRRRHRCGHHIGAGAGIKRLDLDRRVIDFGQRR